MVTLLLLLPPAAFALLAAGAAVGPAQRPRALIRAIVPLSLLALAGAAAATALLLARGPLQSSAIGGGMLALGLRLDALSAPLLLLVTTLGAIVLRFSCNYLAGDPRHGRFLGQLALTVASALLLVMAGTLPLLFVMWVTSSLSLHRLLRFYAERRGAVTAARKKYLVARTSDVTLAVACLLLAEAFGTSQVGPMIDAAALMGAGTSPVPGQVQAAVALLVLAALFKSAQFPTHGWLVDVMEAPTPVSALLHAGLLNAGPFLILRFAPLLTLAPAARVMLLAVALVTALTMALSMASQSRIKTALGYSSAAHMGFTLVLCALGLFPLAVLHLVAHSCYKAYAFLRSGSAVDAARAGTTLGLDGPLPEAAVAAAIAVALAMVGVAGTLSASMDGTWVLRGLIALLAIGLVPLLARGFAHGGTGVVQPLLASAVVVAAFFGLKWLVTRRPSPALPMVPVSDAVSLALLALAVGLAALVVWLPLVGARGRVAQAWAQLYLYARHGWYANVRFDFITGAYRLSRRPTLVQEFAE